MMEEDVLPFSILAVGKKGLVFLNCHRVIPIINCYVCEVINHDHLHFTVVVHVETPGLPHVRVLLFCSVSGRLQGIIVFREGLA